MLYLVALIVIGLCLFIIYKEQGKTRFFLFTLALGWLIAIFNFYIYLDYVMEKDLYLYIFWDQMPFIISSVRDIFNNYVNIETSIILMNFGVLIFIYSCTCFSISFTSRINKSNRIYYLLLIIPLMQLVIYSPNFFKFVFFKLFGDNNFNIDIVDFYKYENIIYIFTRIINLLYIISSLIIIIINYFRNNKLKFFRSYIILIFIGILSMELFFISNLWWAPKRMISLTTLTNITHIMPVSFLFNGNLLNIIPFVTLVIFILISIAIYIYNTEYTNFRKSKDYIVKTSDVTDVGMKFYTHMIKNYIMSTQIDAEKIKSNINKDNYNNLEKYADRIIYSSNDMLDIINKLNKKLSSITLNLKFMNIMVPIEKAVNLVDLDGIDFKNRSSDKDLKTMIDCKHMKEVILNILNNSVHAMDGEKKEISIEIFRDRLWIVIIITDSGKGIEKENINRIFSPFFTTKEKNSNWGLGLSYCYRVIMAHKGKIFVDSTYGKGTSFKILLPYFDNL